MYPLYSSSQIREADNFAINTLNIPSLILMENASISIFDELKKIVHKHNLPKNISIVCGKGNNGGDGLALARHLINYDYFVNIIVVGEYNELSNDAKINYDILINLTKLYNNSNIFHFKTIKDLNVVKDSSIIVDALLGTGTVGELRTPYEEIIKTLNLFDIIKVAIDIPSGLNCDTGNASTVFKADYTITLAELKKGLFFSQGYTNSGIVKKGYIGLGKEYFFNIKTEDFLIEQSDAINGLPQRLNNIHKYQAGKLLVIAGSGSMPGAAIYATNSAIYSGAGAVFLAFPNSIKSVAQTKIEAAIVYPIDDKNNEYLSMNNIGELDEKIKWADAVVLGPGLGRNESTQKAIDIILANYKNKKIVIDADALFVLKDKKYKNYNLVNKVLTPHHQEFCNLLNISKEELEKDILFYGKEFAKETKSFLILKGAPSIIFSPKGEAFINSVGNSGMAKFAIGDTLTGIIASFIAQSNDILNSIISATYIHSLAADNLLKEKTEFGIVPSDLIENIPQTIKMIRDNFVQK